MQSRSSQSTARRAAILALNAGGDAAGQRPDNVLTGDHAHEPAAGVDDRQALEVILFHQVQHALQSGLRVVAIAA